MTRQIQIATRCPRCGETPQLRPDQVSLEDLHAILQGEADLHHPCQGKLPDGAPCGRELVITHEDLTDPSQRRRGRRRILHPGL